MKDRQDFSSNLQKSKSKSRGRRWKQNCWKVSSSRAIASTEYVLLKPKGRKSARQEEKDKWWVRERKGEKEIKVKSTILQTDNTAAQVGSAWLLLDARHKALLIFRQSMSCGAPSFLFLPSSSFSFLPSSSSPPEDSFLYFSVICRHWREGELT